MIEYLKINAYSITPKYVQLASCIQDVIRKRLVKKEELLPSINELSSHLELSRDSVVRAYRYLREKRIIGSWPGKGYYVKNECEAPRYRVAFFLNRMSAHKKIVFDAFMSEMNGEASADIFVYNSDIDYFKILLQETVDSYDYLIIFPHFFGSLEKVNNVFSKISSGKLIFLSDVVKGFDNFYGAVVENYQEDLYAALYEFASDLSKFQCLKMIFPDKSDYPKAIIKGFYHFCDKFGFRHELIGNARRIKIASGDCYINLVDEDLPILLDKLTMRKLVLGKDIGLISYNETKLKKYILNGLTTISTDFTAMGYKAASLIKCGNGGIFINPFSLVKRQSI
ncbi:GntR family transcriptional regulator [Sphingobacterium sp. LRF_L2]|uniref:GntR family transcriptional regulator n=1 Tax=Sphingobacterium sp. LRF_L2 TaxID=3369421 RepID=UPI003F5DD2AB